MSINNIPIIQKVLVVLSLFAVLAIGSTVFSASKMHAIDDGYSGAIAHEGQTALYLARSNRALVQVRAAVAALEIANTDEGNKRAADELQKARQDFIDLTNKAKAADVSDTYKIGDLQARGLDVVDKNCAKSIKLGAAAAGPDAIFAAQGEFLANCDPVFESLITDSTKSVDIAVAAQKKLGGELSDVTSSTITLTYGVVLAGLALVVALAWFSLRRWISVPLQRLAETMKALAGGDLSVAVTGAERRDEVGLMASAVQVFKDNGLKLKQSEAVAADARRQADEEKARNEADRAVSAKKQAQVVESIGQGLDRLSSGNLVFRLEERFSAEYDKLRTDFNGAMEKLQDTLGTVSVNTSGIRSGTGEISAAADDLSRRTEQQAASLEETAAALDEITATVRKTSEGALHARDVVGAAKKDAEHSGQVVRQAVEAMSGIEKSAGQIGQIIGVIDEIAFQTNLLALNAGVEAARAGEAGRGFAVVASEVRALAQRSAEAAKEIKALILASSQQVEQGVDLVGQTGKALERIMVQITEINGIVNNIAASAQEQATGLDQVNTAINQMDQVTQQNAAMVEESTAASHALAEKTEELGQLIGRFQLGREEARPGSRPAASGRGAPVPALKTTGRGGAARKPAPEAHSWEDF